jgi:hypothetical protein
MEEFRRLLRSSAPNSWLFERTRTGGIECSPVHSIKRARAATFALRDVVLYPGVARLAVARLRPLGYDRTRVACRAVARGNARLRPSGLRRGSLHSLSLCDSNLQPDRYERSTLAGNSNKISVSRSGSFTFVRVCSRGFCRITGGMEERRKPPTGLWPRCAA